MDDQAYVKTYGNTDLPEGTEDRPLVTFALFAYNQEKYIREAVEGAFSQTYSPLEIILSDDCSSDRTFEIMEGMAREYKGPHVVKVRRALENGGLANHINRVALIAQGSIVVVAAGDDISDPKRTECHVKLYINHPKTFAVLSDYRAFPNPERKSYATPSTDLITLAEIIYNGGGVQIGATYSYRKTCLTRPQPIPEWLTSEDRLLPYRAALLGRVRAIREPLIAYRMTVSEREQEIKSKRVLGLNHPRHLANLRYELQLVTKMKVRKWPVLWMTSIFLGARRLELSLAQSCPNLEIIISIAFYPLRLIRKIAVVSSRIELR